MTFVRIESLAHRGLDVAARIHAVQMAAYAQEAELLGVADFPPLRRMPHDIQAAEERFIGAFIEAMMVGSLSIESTARPEEVNVASLVVAPEYQRKGIGRLLLPNALAVYAAFCFVECGRHKLGSEGLELVKLCRIRSGELSNTTAGM